MSERVFVHYSVAVTMNNSTFASTVVHKSFYTLVRCLLIAETGCQTVVVEMDVQ